MTNSPIFSNTFLIAHKCIPHLGSVNSKRGVSKKKKTVAERLLKKKKFSSIL